MYTSKYSNDTNNLKWKNGLSLVFASYAHRIFNFLAQYSDNPSSSYGIYLWHFNSQTTSTVSRHTICDHLVSSMLISSEQRARQESVAGSASDTKTPFLSILQWRESRRVGSPSGPTQTSDEFLPIWMSQHMTPHSSLMLDALQL